MTGSQRGGVVVFIEGHYFGSEILRQYLGKGISLVKSSTPTNDLARRQLLTYVDSITVGLGPIKGKFFFTGCPVDVGANIAEREFKYQPCCHRLWRGEMVTRLSKLNDIQYFFFLGSRGHSQYCTPQDDVRSAIESRLKIGTTFIYLTESKVLAKEIDECDSAVIDILWLVKRYRGRVYMLNTCSFLSDEELDRILSKPDGIVLYT